MYSAKNLWPWTWSNVRKSANSRRSTACSLWKYVQTYSYISYFKINIIMKYAFLGIMESIFPGLLRPVEPTSIQGHWWRQIHSRLVRIRCLSQRTTTWTAGQQRHGRFTTTELARVNFSFEPVTFVGGALLDLGCYLIQFAQFIFKEDPIKITSSATKREQGSL